MREKTWYKAEAASRPPELHLLQATTTGHWAQEKLATPREYQDPVFSLNSIVNDRPVPVASIYFILQKAEPLARHVSLTSTSSCSLSTAALSTSSLPSLTSTMAQRGPLFAVTAFISIVLFLTLIPNLWTSSPSAPGPRFRPSRIAQNPSSSAASNGEYLVGVGKGDITG